MSKELLEKIRFFAFYSFGLLALSYLLAYLLLANDYGVVTNQLLITWLDLPTYLAGLCLTGSNLLLGLDWTEPEHAHGRLAVWIFLVAIFCALTVLKFAPLL